MPVSGVPAHWSDAVLDETAELVRQTVHWAANKGFEISKFKFKLPRARTYEIIGLLVGCIEAKFCK